MLWSFQRCPPKPHHLGPSHVARSSASPKTLSCPWAFKGGASSDLRAGWYLCASGEEEVSFPGVDRDPAQPTDTASASSKSTGGESRQQTCVLHERGKVGVFQGKAFPLLHVRLKIIQWPTTASHLAYRETTISAQFTAFWGREHLVI